MTLSPHFKEFDKNTALSVWRSMEQMAPVFFCLENAPEEVTNDDLVELESFVVVLYKEVPHLARQIKPHR